MNNNQQLARSSRARLRLESFGATCWLSGHPGVIVVGLREALILLAHDTPANFDETKAELALASVKALDAPSISWSDRIDRLVSVGLLEQSADRQVPRPARYDIAATQLSDRPALGVIWPLWVHLQPFTKCNQRCIHCYCDGGTDADPVLLPTEAWVEIVRKLADAGVREVYVTGGESLLYKVTYAILDEIARLGMRTGMSTNATTVSDRVLAHLARLNLSRIQVSLDGASDATYELIRGHRGGLGKALLGIERLSTVATVVLNTVVNTHNLHELDDILELGRKLGVQEFKFFPQKPVGRGASPGAGCLDDEQLERLFKWCSGAIEQNGDWITALETLWPGSGCGSASTGFSIDQRGDVFPCIFGIEDRTQRAGSILEQSVRELWFDSPVFQAFRARSAIQPCRRCEHTC